MTQLDLTDGTGTTLTIGDCHPVYPHCIIEVDDRKHDDPPSVALTLPEATRLRDWLSGFIAEHQDAGRDADSFKHNPSMPRA